MTWMHEKVRVYTAEQQLKLDPSLDIDDRVYRKGAQKRMSLQSSDVNSGVSGSGASHDDAEWDRHYVFSNSGLERIFI